MMQKEYKAAYMVTEEALKGEDNPKNIQFRYF
jgi:hypothetical protein